MSARQRVGGVWEDITGRQSCAPAAARRVLGDLMRAYEEPHRHYHTLDHIAALLLLLAEHGREAADPDALRLAILFHDAVYDPARSDNEQASADRAEASLSALGFPPELLAKVARYILATRHGQTPSSPVSDPDLALLLDLDLSILAAPAAEYAAYARAIRCEYGAVPDDAYRPGRRRVLASFLARERIYLTLRLGPLWEAQARTNLAREVAQLA